MLLRSIALVVATCITGFAGCSGVVAPTPPPHWESQAVESMHGFHRDRSKLQVIVTYDPTYSTHAAMRLAGTGEKTLFWDPAGRYAETGNGRYEAHVKRVNDLIVENGPTLETYWMSSVNASDVAMEVFEWDLSAEQTWRMRQALLQGAGLERTGSDFRTKTTKPFCSLAVSRFLSTFSDGAVALDDSYFLPHSLAQALYGQNPDRVIVFRRGRKTTVYTNLRPRIARQRS